MYKCPIHTKKTEFALCQRSICLFLSGLETLKSTQSEQTKV